LVGRFVNNLKASMNDDASAEDGRLGAEGAPRIDIKGARNRNKTPSPKKAKKRRAKPKHDGGGGGDGSGVGIGVGGGGGGGGDDDDADGGDGGEPRESSHESFGKLPDGEGGNTAGKLENILEEDDEDLMDNESDFGGQRHVLFFRA
jgi:hypothetical protein